MLKAVPVQKIEEGLRNLKKNYWKQSNERRSGQDPNIMLKVAKNVTRKANK
jgi:hypothetical protein